jgi:hypothetical protein
LQSFRHARSLQHRVLFAGFQQLPGERQLTPCRWHMRPRMQFNNDRRLPSGGDLSPHR